MSDNQKLLDLLKKLTPQELIQYYGMVSGCELVVKNQNS